MQVALIPADPAEMITFRDVKDGDDLAGELSALVGGDFQALPISNYAMTMYRHYNAKAEALPVNHRATVLANWAEVVHAADTISGDVVLTGPSAVDGTDLPIVDTHKWWLIRFDNQQTELAGLGVGD
ncbi:MAG TPA: hypothetical protein VF867_15320 [Arthrobacter sp.]